MKIKMKFLALVFSAILAICITSHSSVVFASQNVYDGAHVLNESTIDKIDKINEEDLSKIKGHPQIAVITVKSTDGEDIADYAQEQADRYHFGRKGWDNGVLLVVATKDRQVRMQTGYGVEDALPDIYVDNLVSGKTKKDLHNGDWNRGILRMVKQTRNRLQEKVGLIKTDDVIKKEVKQKSRFKTYFAYILTVLILLFCIITVIYFIVMSKISKRKVKGVNELKLMRDHNLVAVPSSFGTMTSEDALGIHVSSQLDAKIIAQKLVLANHIALKCREFEKDHQIKVDVDDLIANTKTDPQKLKKALSDKDFESKLHQVANYLTTLNQSNAKFKNFKTEFIKNADSVYNDVINEDMFKNHCDQLLNEKVIIVTKLTDELEKVTLYDYLKEPKYKSTADYLRSEIEVEDRQYCLEDLRKRYQNSPQGAIISQVIENENWKLLSSSKQAELIWYIRNKDYVGALEIISAFAIKLALLGTSGVGGRSGGNHHSSGGGFFGGHGGNFGGGGGTASF